MKYIHYKIITILLIAFSLSSCGSKVNSDKESFFYIRTEAGFDEIMDSLSTKLKDIESFKSFASKKDYASKIKPGKYKIEIGESNSSLLDKLVIGNQEEVGVMIRNEPTIFHLAGSVSKKIEADSTEIVQAIIDWAKQKDPNLSAESVKIYFIPNTYNYYWPTTGGQFVNRMITEFDKVWTEERQQKAKDMNFTPLQVFTLASIVQMESAKVDEQPQVAQAYLNRLDKGMKLQADPTSIYAYKLQNGFDHKIQRVKSNHLIVPSDYNTYRVTGLPPAPICLPNLSAVDAVLNPEKHNYVYFCADPDRPGYHSFANTYEEHKKNAAKYRAWLEEKGIQ